MIGLVECIFSGSSNLVRRIRCRSVCCRLRPVASSGVYRVLALPVPAADLGLAHLLVIEFETESGDVGICVSLVVVGSLDGVRSYIRLDQSCERKMMLLTRCVVRQIARCV